MGGQNPFDDIATAVREPGGRHVPESGYVLTVQTGPDRGKQFHIEPDQPFPVLLGQGPACHVQLADHTVSRRHASLEIADGRLRVTDLGSTNGTRVQGAAVIDAYLADGQLLGVGSTTIEVSVEAMGRRIELTQATRFGRTVGASPEMRRLYPVLERLASTDIPVVIEGETGTGKEVLAESIHEEGPRASGPFVVFDCTAASPTLLESELFGHERGAFTGAVAPRTGVFQQADGGTLLIDEIGDLDVSLQPKLLRAIERGEIRPVGSERTIRVDVRVLAATRRNLDVEVQEGRFRDDLFHRLAVGRVELPPLRRRRGDILVLAEHFWRELGGDGALPQALLDRWQSEAWPGNVRELRNVVARHRALGELAMAATQGPQASGDFIERVLAELPPLPVGRERVVEEFERRYIERVLELHGGHVARAARASGIAHRYFQLLRKRRQG